MKKAKYIMTVTMAIMCFLLTMIIFMQFKVAQETKETNIDTMKEAELRQQLSNWKSKYEETKEKTTELDNTLETYKKESSSDSKTKEALEKELETLEQALGKTNVEGEGIIITLREKKENELVEDEFITPIVAEDLIYIVNSLKDAGAEIVEVDFRYFKQALAAYYIIACAEASSNLARYDGVRYGYRAKEYTDYIDMYYKTRSEGFGSEVKRRIMLGTYALSSGYYDAYYKKGMQVRTVIINEYNKIFEQCDVLMTPTSATTAFKIGEKVDDPLQMYMSDTFTVPINIAGIPAVSIPAKLDRSGLPIGIQIVGPALGEEQILQAAWALEQSFDFRKNQPNL